MLLWSFIIAQYLLLYYDINHVYPKEVKMLPQRETRYLDPSTVKTIVVKGRKAVTGSHEERGDAEGKILITLPSDWAVLEDRRGDGTLIIFQKPTSQAPERAPKAARNRPKTKGRRGKGPRVIPLDETTIEILLPRRGKHPEILDNQP